MRDRVFVMDPLSNHSLRIWIAEDEDELREALGKSLSREGREILLFADGKELLQHLKRDSAFDIIIADLLMPEVDGLQVLQESKECNPEGIVIIMTGYASLDTAIQAIRGGDYDYIRKPPVPAPDAREGRSPRIMILKTGNIGKRPTRRSRN